MQNKKILKQKTFSRYRPAHQDLPNLVEHQTTSFKWLVETGIDEVFKEFSPIRDYGEKKFDLSFERYELGEPVHDEYYAKKNNRSFEAPLKAVIKLKNKTLGTENEQEIFLADFPMMTNHGTFIINGVERVVVPQLARSSGVFFTSQLLKGNTYFGAKIIPGRGVWIEIETEADGAIFVRIDRKRKLPITSFLRILGAKFDKDMIDLFSRIPGGTDAITATLEKDSAKTTEEAFIEMYRRMRDGDIATPETARDFVLSVLGEERYDLSEVGRHRFNHRFKKATNKDEIDRRTLSLDDLVTILSKVMELNADPDATADDIDHLGFRRVRFVGEMMVQKIRVGVSRMKRNIQDRMSTIEPETSSPVTIVNPRPLQAAIKEFFNTNQLSQFMQQQNMLTELEHLRTLSALGPGGLTRERAGFEVRDVHPSHYGRVCPIHTPEGPNIGLILHLANFSVIDRFGFMQTPYIKVVDGRLTDEVEYLNALEEENAYIAHAATELDSTNAIVQEQIEVRHRGEPTLLSRKDVEYMDVSTLQPFSVATSMIPFLENDDANRALMGSNMQKQATPCLVPEVPLVGTGIESRAAIDTGRLIVAKESGTVVVCDARKISVKNQKGKIVDYPLVDFTRTNDMSCFFQRPVVSLDQKVTKGELLADTSSTVHGQLALGQNALVAFMPWSGANYEDAIILSERLVKNAKFSSIHMEVFECVVRDTKLGAEVTTHDIPNVGEAKLKNLDEEGIVRIGAEVHSGDILVGKVTPKGETQLTPEERLLRSIFGEKAKDVKDTSLRLQGGKRGRVVGVQIFSREAGDQLESGILKKVQVTIAQVRSVSVGDKLAGRHGNKGVISRILPEEDMPYMEDGTPIDVILTPLGVPSRMNLGQILELHLGLAAHTLDYQAICPPFAGATEKEIREELVASGYPENGKVSLRDGRTGDMFNQKIAIGYMYIMKLHHMVEDKIHMRSIGPYSLITQQPLGGKAQNGGQRFGEMEVWALLGYGSAYTLREMLTVKSDDIQGRSAAFDAIVREGLISHTNTPAAFNVLTHHLRALALDVRLERDNQEIKNN
ncbi:TPA: DNA-directed RNA polymerase subunit beta [Patescibacteria group bacterium]|nr:MAG: DNA-directed RNA polymerase subunit beta [Parcubacteria group bacterium GW2011_GWD2_42_14]HCC04936.1 DNA-directed RNA polymerase subunit beta [Patescibacteria group bacterium]